MFDEKIRELFAQLGTDRKMVLSTADGTHVTSRTMSVVIADGSFYFQTGSAMRKYRQLAANPRAALCYDNVQIEGVCTDLGSPAENEKLMRLYKKCYEGSYNAYSRLESERLLRFTPTYIKKWVYEGGKPFEEVFDFVTRTYEKRPYDNQ